MATIIYGRLIYLLHSYDTKEWKTEKKRATVY